MNETSNFSHYIHQKQQFKNENVDSMERFTSSLNTEPIQITPNTPSSLFIVNILGVLGVFSPFSP